MSDPALQRLRAGLATLEAALEDGDLAAAERSLAGYDRSLRTYLHERGRTAPLDALGELLRLQGALMARMRQQRDGIAGELRRLRRAGSASRAYVQADAR